METAWHGALPFMFIIYYVVSLVSVIEELIWTYIWYLLCFDHASIGAVMFWSCPCWCRYILIMPLLVLLCFDHAPVGAVIFWSCLYWCCYVLIMPLLVLLCFDHAPIGAVMFWSCPYWCSYLLIMPLLMQLCFDHASISTGVKSQCNAAPLEFMLLFKEQICYLYAIYSISSESWISFNNRRNDAGLCTQKADSAYLPYL